MVCRERQRDEAGLGHRPGGSSAGVAGGNRVLSGPRLRVVLLSAPVPPGATDIDRTSRCCNGGVLVGGWETAGHGELGWDGKGVGRGQRPGTVHSPGPYE